MAKRAEPKFELQFRKAEVRRLTGSPDDREQEALAAGRAISDGAHIRRHLDIIFRWKTRGRGISRLDRNSPHEIAEALEVAKGACNERIAVAALCGLYGINVPVASAILTCIAPETYTIIDFRALEALGYTGSDRSIEFYLKYLRHCRLLAKQCDVSLRQLDHALWNWSKQRAKK